jgi:hypothetical protein
MTQHPSLKRTGIALACVCLLLHLTGCATLNVVTAERLNSLSPRKPHLLPTFMRPTGESICSGSFRLSPAI